MINLIYLTEVDSDKLVSVMMHRYYYSVSGISITVI